MARCRTKGPSEVSNPQHPPYRFPAFEHWHGAGFQDASAAAVDVTGSAHILRKSSPAANDDAELDEYGQAA